MIRISSYIVGLLLSAASVVYAEGSSYFPPVYDVMATPEQDKERIQKFFRDRFPDLPWEEFANGMYAMDATVRQNWEQIEEFPPYEPVVEEGERLWSQLFKNGKSYSSCFGEPGVVNQYPKWDAERSTVVTVPMAINLCREENGEEPLKYGKPEIIAVNAYMAFKSRGKLTNVVVPVNDAGALEAYKNGKDFYFARRGQLNMSCAQCHFGTSGMRIRANVLSPALGQSSHWPAYRSKWGGMVSIHRRFTGCNKQVRAKPYPLQSEEYRNLEYFHTHMSNGIPLNGPGARF